MDSVDLIAGTSTGGLLALALAHGVDLQKIRDLYEVNGAKVFDDSWLDDLVNLGQIMGPQYDNKKLEQQLKALLGKTTLAQLKKKVLITAFDMDNEAKPAQRTWKPKIFHNFMGSDSDGSELAYKVGLYTSAAPTYFPSVDGYVDGGVLPTTRACVPLRRARTRASATVPRFRKWCSSHLAPGHPWYTSKGNVSTGASGNGPNRS